MLLVISTYNHKQSQIYIFFRLRILINAHTTLKTKWTALNERKSNITEKENNEQRKHNERYEFRGRN